MGISTVHQLKNLSFFSRLSKIGNVYPLVNVYKKLWNITMLFMAKSTISSHFSWFFVVGHGPSCVFFRFPRADFSAWDDPFAPRKNEANLVAVSKIRVKLEQPRM